MINLTTIHIYTEDSNKKVKMQYTRKIDQD